jgi:hypothetical protein
MDQLTKLDASSLEDLVSRGLTLLPPERRNAIIKDSVLGLESNELGSVCDSGFLVLARRVKLLNFTPQFATKSLKAMESLQEEKRPNSLYKLACILSQSKMALDRMPWGLIQYQIDFFAANHINEVDP